MKNGFHNLQQAEIFSLLAMLFLLMFGAKQVAPSVAKNVTEQTYPPSISIPSSDLSFETAKAFPNEGADYLREYVKLKIVPELENQLDKYDVDMIEVIGHADGTPINGKGTLDGKLLNDIARLNASTSTMNFEEVVQQFKELEAGSNSDLGLIRALIIVKTLEDLKKEGECKCNVKAFRAYSAGQLYLSTAEPLAAPANLNSDPLRRRIEVRLTKWPSK
jgi:hypothetical protein